MEEHTIKEGGKLASSTPDGVPQYVLDHAPLLHLYTLDPYCPSSLAAHLRHTSPLDDKFQKISIPDPPLTLANLDRLNSVADTVYLTSNDDVAKDPEWLEGSLLPEEKTCVVIVVPRKDLGGETVDVFYFYFFSFNWGGVVLSHQLGDHVGDWEHAMIRFVASTPQSVWLSQHANGEAYTFSCLEKDGSGRRPILYCANGSHALYPTPGPHDHTLPNLNLPVLLLLVDETDKGPLYDILLVSYYYTYNPNTTFTAHPPSTPTGFLNFTGKWGDKEYPSDDPRQKGRDLLGLFKKYVGGPTGPADKQLVRKEVWPENQFSGGQRIRKRLTGKKTWVGDKFEKMARWFGFSGCGKKGVRRGVRVMRVDGKVVA